MLLELLATFLIVSSMGVGAKLTPVLDNTRTTTPTIRQAPQPKKENQEQDLTYFEWYENFGKPTTGNITISGQEEINGHTYSTVRRKNKTSKYSYNNALAVNYTEYIQTTSYLTEDVETYYGDTHLNNPEYVTFASPNKKWQNNILLQLKIDTLNAFVETDNGFTVTQELGLDKPVGQNVEFDVNIEYYTSIDNRLEQYQNQNTWTNYNYIQTLWDTITSPTYGFNYNYDSYYINNIGEGDNITTESHKQTLNLVRGATNYVYILITVTDTQDNWMTVQDGTSNEDLFGWITNINIQGYYIPPITDYEVIDIPGLMYNILSLPFSFISTAFDVTLFPGTPYQLNISNLILAVLAALILIFVLKTIVKMKGY